MREAITLPITVGDLQVRLACGADEIEATLRLRYEVFVEQMGATPSPEAARSRMDRDAHDEICDHLIVFDTRCGRVLGTYRFIGQWMLGPNAWFYSEGEYDLSPLRRAIPTGLLEVGRACVAPDYQRGTILRHLWRGIAAYVVEHQVGYLMGCGSFPGTDPGAHSYWLNKLYRERLMPEECRVRALPARYVPMHEGVRPPQGEPPELPKLIQGYLKLGEAWVGDGAVIDHEMNTVDVFLFVSTAGILKRYREFFLRGVA